MNNNRYRLVFNKTRGMLMAVAECSTSQRKAVGGQPAASAVGKSPSVVATLRPVAWTVLLALGLVHIAAAQIVADPAAGRGPDVTRAPNGVPMVNINAPSGAGVSHNQYQQFSVDGRGAILNNAAAITRTQLGGYVPGNAGLGAKGPARVILNEVTGGHPTQLNGFVEVAGQRADVVISNGNSISVNGGGFINANRATLTTGAPVFGGDGSLAAFRVMRGGIQVEGQGFNGSSLDQVDLIARSVRINGKLWANNANVIAGTNQVDYASLGVQVIAGEGSPPTVGIDVSNLGGMYANRIRLIGTEAGVGVRNAGTLAAQAGDFTLDSAGRVSLTGTTSAAQALHIRGAAGIDNTGTTAARAAMTLVSDAEIGNTGSLVAGRDLAIAGQAIRSTGTLAAGIDDNGGATQAGSLTLQGTESVSARGRNLAAMHFQASGGVVSLAGSQTQAGDDIALTSHSGGVDLSDANVTAGRALRAQAQGALQTDRARITAATLDAAAQRLSNRAGTLYARQGATIATRGDLDNAGGAIVTDAGDLDVSAAATLDNADGRVTNAGAGLTTVKAAILRNSNRGGGAGAGAIGGNGAVTVTADRLSNTDKGQLIAGNDLTLRVSQIADNSGGQIYAAGRLSATGTQAAWHNEGGTLSGKIVRLDGQSLSNRHGTVLAESDLATDMASDIDNTEGSLQATGTMSVQAGGAITNDGGRVVNTGGGSTRVAADTIANRNALVGGNGDVSLAARRLANHAGGQVVSGKALDIRTTQSFSNTGGKTYAGTDLAVHADAASVDNNGGSLAAGVSATLRANTLSNASGKILADRDISLQTGALSGAGAIHAGQDLSIGLRSDYTHYGSNLLKAERNLSLTTTGVFTNLGRLQAVNALSLTASRIANQAGAVIHAGATTLSATGEMANAGRIEGHTLTTNSDVLANTGTLIGDTVTTNARVIQNDGASALMAATDSLNLYAREQLANMNGATLYSLGDINIAANGERDDRGLLKHRTGRVLNDSSTIEGGSSYSVVEIAAQDLVNQRPEPMVETDITVGKKHERKREKYIHCATTNPYPQMGCGQAVWEGPYKTPLDATFDAAQIVSRDDVKKRLVVTINGVATQIDYNTLTESNGTLAVNYWDGFNRDIHYDPATEYETRNDARRGWQRVEIARDTTTTTTTERDAKPNQRGANLISGGDMILANVGTLANRYSAIAAGGSMLIGDQQQTGDVSAGHYGATNVVNVGRTLYQRVRQDVVSTYAWNKETDKDVGPVVQPSTVETPTVVGAIGGTITAGKRITVYGGGIQNEDVAKADPMAGTGSTELSGTTVKAQGVGRVSLANTPLTLPANGLFTYHGESGATYLIETDPRFAHYGNFVSSDYMLGLLGIDPSMTQKRLGDGFYEQKLIRDQVTTLTGRVYLSGHDSAEGQYKALMAAGVHAAQQFNILPGMALTAAQMSALTTDIVWLVSETVTLPGGGSQTVLVPRVYLAQAHAMDLSASGALIAGNDIALHSAGSMQNSGVIDAGSRLSIAAGDDLLNRGGTIRSTGVTAISAGRDIVNQSGQISGDKVGLVAARDIRNETLFDQKGVTHAAGNAKASTSLYGQQAGISSTGEMLISAGRDVSVTGATLDAGGDAAIVAGRDLTFDTLAGRTEQSVFNSDKHRSADASTQHAVTTVKTGGSLTTTSAGDTTLRGTRVQSGADLSMIAGGDLTASAVTDERTHDNVARQSRQGQLEAHSRDQTTVGVELSAGGNATLAAVKAADKGGGVNRTDGKGNVTLTATTVTAGVDGKGAGALTVVADRDVSIVEARELHDSSLDIRSRSGSFVSRTNKSLQTSSRADLGVGSTLSGDSVKIQAGNDLLVRQSAIAGTQGVALTATQGNVLITAGQNIREESSAQQQKRSGISAFAGQGGIGVSVGSSSASAASHTLAITQSDARSVVGASNGNVVITAGKDATIIGSDLIAGRKSASADPAAGNIDILAKNVMVAEGVDYIAQSARASSKSSGLSVAVAGTPYDTGKNLKAAQQASSGVTRSMQTMNELGASALTTPQLVASVGSQRSNSETSSVAAISSGSSLSGAGNVRIRATGNGATDAAGKALDGNILVSGSHINAGGTALLDAERDVTLRASTDTYAERNNASRSGWNVSSATPGLGDVARHIGGGPNNSGVGMLPYGSERANSNSDLSSSKQNASVVTGNAVGIRARSGDITVAGSGIAADADVALSAARGKINILSGQDTLSQRSDSASRQIGDLGGTGYSGTVGVRSESHRVDGTQATQNTIRSQIVSKNGSVTMVAGDAITARGADIAAGTDITMIGKNVIFDPGQDTASQNESHRVSQYGSTLALSGYTVTAAQAVENAARAVEEKKDGRVATLYGVQAGLAVANGIQGIQTITSGGTSATAAIKVTASVGGGSQTSESHSKASTHQGTTIKAGNAVTIVATGSGGKDADGFATDGDITGRGVNISGKTVNLTAARDIDLESAQDRASLDSRSSGNNASVGIGLGLGGDQNGFTLELAASQNEAKANGESVTHRNSMVTATDKLTVTSGRDTNLKGAQLIADTFEGNVGRHLNIESPPDTETYTSRESSSGVQASLCVPPFCYGTTVHASGSATQGKTDSKYSSVQAQSGIYAGKGGFNVNVKGNTDLKGGILASTADKSKNSLTTGTLTTSDIENKAEYRSSSSTFVASYSGGKSLEATRPDIGEALPARVEWGGNTNLLQGAASSLAATAAGNAQKDLTGNAGGTTKSAIAEGTVRITDAAGQQAKTGKSAEDTLANLNRDTENANQSIDKIFDAQKVKDQQELNRVKSQVAQQAAPLIYNAVGDALVGRSPETKAAVHALVGGLMSQAIGGSFGAGAAGGAAASLAMEAFGQALLDQKDLSESDRKALVQLAGTIVGGAAGGIAGGTLGDAAAGANVGKVATENNYLNHVDREAYEKATAACAPNNPKACQQAEIYAEQDRKNDENLAAAVNRCEPGSDCAGVSAFILNQMAEVGCGKNPSSAECNKLGEAWLTTRMRGQGLEAPPISPDDLVPYKGLSSLAVMGVKGGVAALARAGLIGVIKGGEEAAAEAIAKSAARKGTLVGTADDSAFALAERQLPKAEGKLVGTPEKPPLNAPKEHVRSIERQNEAASTLADHGLFIENLKNSGKRGANPDIRINGELADIYSPRTKNPKQVWDTVVDKVDSQAQNIVVNLADSSLTPGDVARYFQRNPVAGLKSLFLIKNGSVTILE